MLPFKQQMNGNNKLRLSVKVPASDERIFSPLHLSHHNRMPDKPTNPIIAKFIRWETVANKALYFAYEKMRARFAKRKFKILFSLKAEREKDIRKSFRLLKHEVHFDEFTPEN